MQLHRRMILQPVAHGFIDARLPAAPVRQKGAVFNLEGCKRLQMIVDCSYFAEGIFHGDRAEIIG